MTMWAWTYIMVCACIIRVKVHDEVLPQERRYVMAESSHNTGALRVSRYEFHLLRIAWVGHVPAT